MCLSKIYRDSFYSLGMFARGRGRGGGCRGDLSYHATSHLASPDTPLKDSNPQASLNACMEGKQRGTGREKWMQVENEKSWQPVVLSQNRTLPEGLHVPATPPAPKLAQVVYRPPPARHLPIHNQVWATLAHNYSYTGLAGGQAASETVHFCLETWVSPSPAKSRPTGESRGCWGRPPGAPSPSAPHPPPRRRSLARTWPLRSLDSPTQTFELSIYITV